MSAALQLTVTSVAGSASVEKNTSRVQVTLAVVTDNGTYNLSGDTSGTITLDGAQIASLAGKKVELNTTTALYSGTHTVTHQADGSRTVTVKASFDVNTGTRWIYAEAELALETIPRASTLTVPAITLGAPAVLAISRASESFSHAITYTFGARSGTAVEQTDAAAPSWTPPLSLATQIPNSPTGSGTLTLITYDGETVVGARDYTFTAVVSGSVAPRISGIVVLVENESEVLRGWDAAVKGKSRLSYEVTAEGAYGSTVTDCSFVCGGAVGTGLSGVTGLLNQPGTFTPRISITDSRGRTASAAIGSVTVYDYAAPSLSAEAFRCDSQGSADESGTCASVTASAAASPVGGCNSVTLRLRYRPAGGAWSGYTALTDGQTLLLPGLAVTTSYEVEISAQDALGGEKTVVYTIPTEAVSFVLREGGTGAGFGKYPEGEVLDMAWPIRMNGCRLEGLAQPEQDDDAATKAYVDAALARLYPVGSIYLSLSTASPAELFGGTWEQICDTFLLAAGSVYEAGSTGGAAEHTLTESELPVLEGELYNVASQSSTNTVTGTGVFRVEGSEGHGYAVNEKTDVDVIRFSAGGGQAHSNMPPYLAVYVWKRTA